jgi:phage protein D
MTASRLRPSRPTDKWQHRLSSRTPTGTELASRQLIQSANRNTVESNETKNNNKSKSPMKEKQRTNLDTSDLLIESRLIGNLDVSATQRVYQRLALLYDSFLD